jgi:hypothetical protein
LNAGVSCMYCLCVCLWPSTLQHDHRLQRRPPTGGRKGGSRRWGCRVQHRWGCGGATPVSRWPPSARAHCSGPHGRGSEGWACGAEAASRVVHHLEWDRVSAVYARRKPPRLTASIHAVRKADMLCMRLSSGVQYTCGARIREDARCSRVTQDPGASAHDKPVRPW